ncbi:MAG TPA: Uma2 family endonuclease, partial [Candidatus Angelobacter sp.]
MCLGKSLKGKSCRPYGSDMRINNPENTLFTYPDISIFCGEVKTLKEDQNTATLPIVIIEILSLSTRNYDRGVKFMLYRAIPSLTD